MKRNRDAADAAMEEEDDSGEKNGKLADAAIEEDDSGKKK
jgi:hypothetical protein